MGRRLVVEIELSERDKGAPFDFATEMSPARLETALWQSFHRLFRVTSVETAKAINAYAVPDDVVMVGDRRECMYGAGPYTVVCQGDDGWRVHWDDDAEPYPHPFTERTLLDDRLVSRGGAS